MKKQVICAIKKDLKEYLRNKKNVVFSISLLLLCTMVFVATKFFPSLINTLIEKAAHLVSNTETITSTLATFFPNNLKSNMGVLASDIAIFYGIVVVLSTYNLIAKEINTGKWIFPLSVGYSPFILIISKGLVYGVGAAFPSVVFYNLYYFLGNLYLSPDYLLTNAIMNSLVLGFAIFAIVYITIMLSMIYKQAIMAAATMLVTLVVAPDVFSLFSFGKFLPTHLLTYVYKANNNAKELIIPIIFIVMVMVLLSFWSSKKAVKIEVAR